jgi:hypothetical protein
MSPNEDQSKVPEKDDRNTSAPKKKPIDVFWMDDEEDREQFQKKEQAERRKANWQGIEDADVLSQLNPVEGVIGEPPSSEENWEAEMQRFERQMRLRSRSGSFAERLSTTALRRFMEAQQKGGTGGRISRLLGNLTGRIFGVIGRPGMAPPNRPKKKKGSKKADTI